MALTDDVQQLVRELVAIESVNPDLVPGGGGEAAIARFVASWLEARGCEVEIVEPAAGRPSVVGVVRGTGGGSSLMLNAHMDTVGAGGMANPFEPEVRGNRVYGRGAYDMKGSLAAIMLAAREARSLHLRGDVVVTAVADEEVASMGTSSVLEHVHTDYAIVTEPTELRVCVAHKGFVWTEVEVDGVAAHGSRADLGVDAIARMGPVLAGVRELDERLRDGPRHPLLGTGSVHASAVEGGGEMSTYPARCVARFERRTVPGETSGMVVREFERLAEPVQGRVRVMLERAPSELGADHPLTQSLLAASGSAGVVGVTYWMDMALTIAAGIPTAAFGPSGQGEHADVEWVDLASVERCVEVYLGVASRLCT